MKLNTKQWTAFFIVAVIFALVEAKGLFLVTPGDENVYFYMAKSVSEGLVPYKDFFYAHPPLHVVALAALIKVFGLNFIILKTATLLACLTSAFLQFGAVDGWLILDRLLFLL